MKDEEVAVEKMLESLVVLLQSTTIAPVADSNPGFRAGYKRAVL